MAITRNETARLMEKDDWNSEEKENIDEVIKYHKLVEEYRDYASLLALEIDNDLCTKLEYFKANQGQLKNKDMIEIVSKYNTAQNDYYKENELANEKPLSLTRRQKINGYTNAAVLIFVVLNFGLLLSFLLLVLK